MPSLKTTLLLCVLALFAAGCAARGGTALGVDTRSNTYSAIGNQDIRIAPGFRYLGMLALEKETPITGSSETDTDIAYTYIFVKDSSGSMDEICMIRRTDAGEGYSWRPIEDGDAVTFGGHRYMAVYGTDFWRDRISNGLIKFVRGEGGNPDRDTVLNWVNMRRLDGARLKYELVYGVAEDLMRSPQSEREVRDRFTDAFSAATRGLLGF